MDGRRSLGGDIQVRDDISQLDGSRGSMGSEIDVGEDITFHRRRQEEVEAEIAISQPPHTAPPGYSGYYLRSGDPKGAESGELLKERESRENWKRWQEVAKTMGVTGQAGGVWQEPGNMDSDKGRGLKEPEGSLGLENLSIGGSRRTGNSMPSFGTERGERSVTGNSVPSFGTERGGRSLNLETVGCHGNQNSADSAAKSAGGMSADSAGRAIVSQRRSDNMFNNTGTGSLKMEEAAWQAMQEEDRILARVREWYLSGILPTQSQLLGEGFELAAWAREFENLTILDGVLGRWWVSPLDKTFFQIAIPLRKRREVLAELGPAALGGDALPQRGYYWPGFPQEVEAWCRLTLSAARGRSNNARSDLLNLGTQSSHMTPARLEDPQEPRRMGRDPLRDTTNTYPRQEAVVEYHPSRMVEGGGQLGMGGWNPLPQVAPRSWQAQAVAGPGPVGQGPVGQGPSRESLWGSVPPVQIPSDLSKEWSSDDRLSKPVFMPGKYDGSGHLTEYLAHFDLCRRANGWDHEQAGVFLGLSLTGIARRLLSGIEPSTAGGYLQLREALICRFQPPNQSARYKAILKAKERGAGECLQAHAEEVERYTRLAYPKADLATVDVMAKDRFVDSLKDQQMQYWIHQGNPDTLVGAVQLALHAEACMRPNGQTQVARSADATLGERMDRMVESATKERQEAAIFRRTVSGQMAQASRPRPPMEQGAMKCFFCNEAGHFKRECQKFSTFMEEERAKRAARSEGQAAAIAATAKFTGTSPSGN